MKVKFIVTNATSASKHLMAVISYFDQLTIHFELELKHWLYQLANQHSTIAVKLEFVGYPFS